MQPARLVRRIPSALSTPTIAMLAAVVTVLGWAACGSGDDGSGAPIPDIHDGAGGVDYNGSTGSGDDELNQDLEDEPDTEDPSQPECAPDSIVDDNGNCVQSCYEGEGFCADADPTLCDGYDPIVAYDCTVCCALPPEDQDCPPEGCEDPADQEDCPPGEDCTYTETCPDGVCDDTEDCSTCAIDCGPCAPECGDGVCDANESCNDCPEDCGDCPATCGDATCSVDVGENCENCSDDCGKCLKVLTWDINAGLKKGKTKVKQTLKSIANLIGNEKPDFVGLQSVDKNTKRSGGIDEAYFIAKRAKMFKRFGAAFNYNGGQYGVAFLSKHPIDAVTKTKMDTSGEWAKRRIYITASLGLETYFTMFHFGVTQLARKDAPRLTQATTIWKDLGYEANSLLVGDLFEEPDGAAVAKLQSNDNLLDMWPDYGNGGLGLTTAKKRIDYIFSALNWYSQIDESCPSVVRSYVKSAKGLASHRPVVTLFQRGPAGTEANCGELGSSSGSGYGGGGYGGGSDGSGGYDDGSLGTGDDTCATDADCAGDPIYQYCVEQYCSECRTSADCTDPDFPTCDEWYECT